MAMRTPGRDGEAWNLRRTTALTSILMLAACTSLGPPRPGRDGEVIRYQTEDVPFCIICQKISLTIASDRRAWIELTRRSPGGDGAEVVRRPVLLTPVQLAAFRARLAPFRPKGELDLRGPAGCRTFASDGGGLRIEWDDGRTVDRLLFYDGCDPDLHRAMREALYGAMDLLGAEGLTVMPSKRPRFR